jgi:hypothetical protein
MGQHRASQVHAEVSAERERLEARLATAERQLAEAEALRGSASAALAQIEGAKRTVDAANSELELRNRAYQVRVWRVQDAHALLPYHAGHHQAFGYYGGGGG